MKINSAGSLFILSMSNLLLSILSSPFFHPFSLAIVNCYWFPLLLTAFLIASFLFPADFDSVLTLRGTTYTGHMRHAKSLHLTQKTHLQKCVFIVRSPSQWFLNDWDKKIGHKFILYRAI